MVTLKFQQPWSLEKYFSPGARFVGVSSFGPAPESIRDIIIHLFKGPLGCSIAIVVGPALQERVEFANERLLAEAQGGLNAEPDFVPQGLDVALLGEKFLPKI